MLELIIFLGEMAIISFLMIFILYPITWTIAYLDKRNVRKNDFKLDEFSKEIDDEDLSISEKAIYNAIPYNVLLSLPEIIEIIGSEYNSEYIQKTLHKLTMKKYILEYPNIYTQISYYEKIKRKTKKNI